MVAELIFVGTELLLGQIVNTNAAYLCRNLARLGVEVRGMREVGDNIDHIAEAVRSALEKADLVITSGGLGPTADDLTREGIAKAINRRLVFDPEVMKGIEELFRRMGREARPIQRKQAYVFETGCQVIPNPVGSAPGLIVEVEGKHIIALPGVPRELQRMCEETVFPWIAERSGSGVIRSLSLKVTGLGESTVQELIQDVMDGLGDNPTIAFLARPGEVTVRITARGASEEEADRLIKGVEEEIRSRLGDNIYGIDPQTLEEVTGGLLLERGEAVAVAETTTGGAIVNRMASVDGSERFLVGGIVLASRRSVEMALGPVGRVVSSDVAERLASWAKSISGATYGLSATALLEPMEGFSESDVGLSYIALAKPDGTICREIRVIGDKPTMKQRISQAAIDLLRREIWRR